MKRYVLLVLIFVTVPNMVTANREEGVPASDQSKIKNWQDPVTGMEFVWVPKGCFEMGSPNKEMLRNIDEGPVHDVCVDGFWMGKNEVTNAQYRKFKKVHNSTKHKGYSLNEDNQPAVYVSFIDTKVFAKWLTRKNGGKYLFRLPREAEWEYAARAGTKAARYWGDNPDEACSFANVHDRTSQKAFLHFTWTAHYCNDDYAVTAPVGSLTPNAFGLFDMLGNVSEWCEDKYAYKAYSQHAHNNPIYADDELDDGMLRGGSWSHDPAYVRSADRFTNTIDSRNNNIGFRLVRAINEDTTSPNITPTGSSVKKTGGKNRFIAYGNGIVYDTETRLEWYIGPDKETTWEEAKSWVESLGMDGGVRRIPTIKQLRSLYNKDVDKHSFPPLFKTSGWLIWSVESLNSGTGEPFNFLDNRKVDWWESEDSENNRVFAVRSRK